MGRRLPLAYDASDIQNGSHILSTLTSLTVNETEKVINASVKVGIVTTTNPAIDVYTGPPPQGLPVPLLIASPVAAVCILIFVCIAYYCHALQLDARARELSMKMTTQDVKVQMTNSVTETSVLSSCENNLDLLSTPKRKSTITIRAPSPCNSFASLKPPGRSPRPSMNWGTFGDQDVLALAASRRHSTFLL